MSAAKWDKYKKFLRNWASLIIAILALLCSSYALYIDNKHYNQSLALQNQQYEELTKPHTGHEEVLDKLSRLDERIETASDWVSSWGPPWAASFRESLDKAEQLSAQADEAWRKKNYAIAESLINEAYAFLNEIPKPPPVRTTFGTEAVVNAQGVFLQTIIAQSSDGQFQIRIEKGVTGKDKAGNPLTTIAIVRTALTLIPPMPQDHLLVGPNFDLYPEGATFEPAITITFTYYATMIPTGANEEDLAIAYWNIKENKWRLVESVVDTATNTISARVNHFTLFTVVARVRPYPVPVNWGLIAGIAVATIVVVGTVVWFLAFRRGNKAACGKE